MMMMIEQQRQNHLSAYDMLMTTLSTLYKENHLCISAYIYLYTCIDKMDMFR